MREQIKKQQKLNREDILNTSKSCPVISSDDSGELRRTGEPMLYTKANKQSLEQLEPDLNKELEQIQRIIQLKKLNFKITKKALENFLQIVKMWRDLPEMPYYINHDIITRLLTFYQLKSFLLHLEEYVPTPLCKTCNQPTYMTGYRTIKSCRSGPVTYSNTFLCLNCGKEINDFDRRLWWE